jgi:ribosomal protein S21
MFRLLFKSFILFYVIALLPLNKVIASNIDEEKNSALKRFDRMIHLNEHKSIEDDLYSLQKLKDGSQQLFKPESGKEEDSLDLALKRFDRLVGVKKDENTKKF